MVFSIGYCAIILCFFEAICHWYLKRLMDLPIFLCVLQILLIFGIFGLNHCYHLHLMAFIIGYCVIIPCFFDAIYHCYLKGLMALPIFLRVLRILLILKLNHYYQPLFYNNILLNGGGLVTVRAEMSSPLLA